MVSKGEMWVFDSSCITQPQSQISTDSRYLTLWLRDAARVKYPHFTLQAVLFLGRMCNNPISFPSLARFSSLHLKL